MKSRSASKSLDAELEQTFALSAQVFNRLETR